MNQPSPNRTGSAEVASLVRRAIRDGKYTQNERLPAERELAKTYGVARGTVREALTMLAEEDLVEIKPGSGTYVRTQRYQIANPVVANARPLELIDARFALEPHICRLAVLHARVQDLEQAEGLLLQMEKCVADPVAFATADTAFHALLAESTGNSLLIWINKQITQVRDHDEWAKMRQLTLNEKIITQYNIQHRKILESIRDRRPEDAANAMKQHLETARLSLTRAAET